MSESSGLFAPEDKTFNSVHLRISTYANLFSERPAIICNDKQISYRELEQSSERAATRLHGLGVGLGSRVALLFEPGVNLIIALLAIHKVGAAFVPLSSSFPQARILSILEGAACKVVFGDPDNRALVVANNIDYVAFDDKFLSSADQSDCLPDCLKLQNNPETTAYIHFTSGSTGTPKGVNVLHRNLTFYAEWSAGFFKETVENRLPLTSSIQFAASISQIYSTLVAGETLHILPDVINDPDKLFAWYAEHPGFGFYCVPTVWKSALDWLEKNNISTDGPAALFLSGEDISEGLLEETFNHFPEIEVWNLYGPTEAVANVSYKKVNSSQDCSIGTPIPQTSFYVVKGDGSEAKVDEEGLLYVAGSGICAGYFGDKQLTESAFFSYTSECDGAVRVYNTGDLVRRTGIREFKFIGRQDQQVKIHGQRIELGEIENRLYRHPQVMTVIVSLIKGEPSYLAAYVESKSGEAIPVDDLRAHLLKFVTAAMVPERWVFLKEFPKLANGKINRKLLPIPANKRPFLSAGFTPATGEREEKIVSIFKKILQIEEVGVDDSFFDLGGNSLKALALIIEIEGRFNFRASFKTLFEHPSPRALLGQIPLYLSEKELPVGSAPVRADTLPLTASQRGLLFFFETYQKNATYNIAYAVTLEGELDPTRLEKALANVVQRHLPLSFRLKKLDDEARFFPEENITIELPLELLGCLPETQRETFVNESISAFAALPFALYNSPLYRCKLYRLDEQKHVLAWVVSHLVFDGESATGFVCELDQIYRGQEPAPLELTFADVLRKRVDYQQSLKFRQDYKFWQEYLKGVNELHSFPTIYQPPELASFKGRRVSTVIERPLREKLLAVCRAQGVTLNMLLLAVFVTTLYKFGQREEYVVASPFANRLDRSDNSLIGYFTNTLLYRINCPSGCRFSDLVESIREDTIGILDHQQLPFEQLVNILRRQGVNLPVSVFKTMFAFHETSYWSKKSENGGLSLKTREIFNQHAKCELHLECFDDHDKIDLELTFAEGVVDESSALQLITVFKQISGEISLQFGSELSALGGLTGDEREEVLRCSAAEKKDYGSTLTLSNLFQETCLEFPDLTAISFADTSISYAALAQKVAVCAGHLATLKLEPEEPIGIFFDNTPELVIAILAAAALRHPYIPIDPTYPKERILYIIEHAEIRYLLTAAGLETDIFSSDSKLVFIDEVLGNSISGGKIEIEAQVPTPDDLLYIIYTSGSTGNPKGVMLPNRGVANYLLWMRDEFKTGTDTKILAKTSISFDISVWEIFLPLISGGTLVLEKRADIESPEQTATVIKAKKVNIFQFVPSGLKLFSDVGMFAQTPSLQKIFCGGEKMPLGLKDDVLSQFKGELYNLYGPTEASIFMSCYRCTSDASFDKVPIGKPIPNSSLYVLDKGLQLQPRNMPGDLYIGGDVLATGYLKNQNKTAQAFKKSPDYLSENIIYATGDRGRLLSCGKFEFLGRDDHQVKIRGYRVELQEIDKVIEKVSGVHQAVTYLNQHSEYDARLHAVVVPAADAVLAADMIRTELKSKLPAYMIPSSITLVKSIPLLPNGKINQKELSRQPVTIAAGESRKNIEVNSNKVERLMVEIWSEVLGRQNFTTRDNFFDVGGHSLLFLKIRDLIQSRLEAKFSIVELYQHPNIAALVEQYKKKMGDEGHSATVSAIRSRIARRIKKYHEK